MRKSPKEVMPFEYDSHQIRSIVIDQIPYFVGKDICDALGLGRTETTMRKLDEDEKLVRKVLASGQHRKMVLVNESGMYTLIIRSNKPEAKKFRKWVTSEVLPTIRRTGGYGMSNWQKDLQAYVTACSPLVGSQNKLAGYLGVSVGVLSSIMQGDFHLVGSRRQSEIFAGCMHLIKHGQGVDKELVGLLMQVEDREVRVALFDRLKKGGAL